MPTHLPEDWPGPPLDYAPPPPRNEHTEGEVPPGLKVSMSVTVTYPDGTMETTDYHNLVAEPGTMAGTSIDTEYDEEIRNSIVAFKPDSGRDYLTFTLRKIRMLAKDETGEKYRMVRKEPAEATP